MRFQLETGGQANLIRTYAPGRIDVNHETYTRSLIVLRSQVIPDWPPQDFADLGPSHFETLAALAPEIVVLGTGQRQQFPRADILAPLIKAGIGCEVMDSGAACRTYNILVSEGRNIAAALLMIDRAGG